MSGDDYFSYLDSYLVPTGKVYQECAVNENCNDDEVCLPANEVAGYLPSNRSYCQKPKVYRDDNYANNFLPPEIQNSARVVKGDSCFMVTENGMKVYLPDSMCSGKKTQEPEDCSSCSPYFSGQGIASVPQCLRVSPAGVGFSIMNCGDRCCNIDPLEDEWVKYSKNPLLYGTSFANNGGVPVDLYNQNFRMM